MYMATQIADGMRSSHNHDDNDDGADDNDDGADDNDDAADDNDDVDDDNDDILMKLLTTFRLQLLGEYLSYYF